MQKTSKSIEQVIIQPDGKWELNTKNEKPSFKRTSDDSDNEVIEITGCGKSITSLPSDTPEVLQTLLPISIDSAKQNDSTQSSSRTTNVKRPIATVIDLTSSADEDDEPPLRPHKRQFNNPGYSTNTPIPVFRPRQNKPIHRA